MRSVFGATVLASCIAGAALAAVEARDADTDAAMALCKQDHSEKLHDHKKSADACAFLVSTGQFEGKELARIYNNWGAEFTHSGEPDEALKRYSKALELWPQYSLAARNISELHGDRGDWALALEYAERSVVAGPDEAANYRQRAYVYGKSDKYDEAEADLEIAMALAPDNRWTRREFGWLAYNRGNYDDAARVFREIVAQDAEDPDGHYGLAYVLIDLDRDQEALDVIADAIAIAESADYYNLRGYIRLQEEKPATFDPDKAAEDLAKAIELSPDLHYAVYHLSAARVFQGEPAKAKILLRQGLNMYVDEPKGRRVLRLMLSKGHLITAGQVAIMLNRASGR